MKKQIIILSSSLLLCLTTILISTEGPNKARNTVDLVLLNEKALADTEQGDHHFCKTDLGDTCTTYGLSIPDCDETANPFLGC